MPDFAGDDDISAGYTQVMRYSDEADYYALLGVSKEAKDSEIRSAYRTLTLSFHPDKQPAHMREAGEHHFEKITDAYNTLIDPKKRVVYDLLGAEGVQQEWSHGGSMENQKVGVKAMSPSEFRRWFLETMKSRERKAVNSMVRSKGFITLGIDASSMISVDEEEGDVYVNVPTVKPSRYAVGYNFRTPLPLLEYLIGEARKDEEDAQAEDIEGDNQPSETSGIEMVISTRVAGKLQKLQQKVIDPSSQTEYLVDLPRILAANDVSIGAAVSHVFGDAAGAKGIFKRRPFSILNDSAVTANVLLLPEPQLETSIGKSIQLVPGTRPFNVNLTTTFSQSLFEILPVVGLQITKNVSNTKLALCSWSSGTLEWPLVIQRLVEPFFGLGLEEGAALPVQLSSLQFAFFSFPKQQKVVGDGEGEEEGDDEVDDEVKESTQRARQQMKTEADKAVSWNVQMQATPENGALAFTYGRNIFSGKAADAVVRSEWSSEGYYPMVESESRSLRLEVQTTVGLDFSLSWHLRGTRQVGEFTRMGLGVGIQSQGLVMTVYWSRLGQRLQLPVSVCSLEVVSAEAAAFVVAVPWLAYCALEFGIIRPRQRKERRKLMIRRHKQLKKQIPMKKAESLQAVELMTNQVRLRQAREDERGGLVITKAEYGYIPSDKKKKNNVAEPSVIDVTIPVAALFKIIGFYDPAPLLPKTLKIWYRYQGRDHFLQAGDNEGIKCPMREHYSFTSYSA
ncbi:DnaJ domain protein [Aspergillus sclerotialis]|uniref:DnaJ domain protein n=1 Tax=Aspergillus sclerotialis TaxID=2070753 RepID=A0A3A2Z816_9EURO|nr:DnaJ domain protein [Aspergillus sclerotialis]